MVEYCGYTHRTCVVPLTRNQRCPADHARWDIEAPPRPLPECTLRALARFAGLHRVDEHVGFIVDAMSYVERGICRNGHRHTVNAFVTPGEPAGRELHGVAAAHRRALPLAPVLAPLGHQIPRTYRLRPRL